MKSSAVRESDYMAAAASTYTVKLPPPPVGGWRVGTGDSCVLFTLTTFRRTAAIPARTTTGTRRYRPAKTRSMWLTSNQVIQIPPLIVSGSNHDRR